MLKRILFYFTFVIITLAMSVSLFAAEIILNITGMTWPASWPVRVRRVLEELDGVKKARVSFKLKEATVEFDEKKVTARKMIDALISEGYGGSLKK